VDGVVLAFTATGYPALELAPCLFLFQVGAIYRHGASKRSLRTFNLEIVKKNQSKTEESRKNIENYASELIEVRG